MPFAESNAEVPTTFRGVQALRGLAACMVVVFHSSQLWALYTHGVTSSTLVWENGAAGVDLFFIISGFVMAVSTLGKGEGPDAARTFIERRLVRIVPLYWLMTTLVLIRLLLSYGVNPPDHLLITPPYVVTSYLLIPFRNSTGTIRPILLPGWTLYYEMFFYVCFALALMARGKVVLVLTIALGVLATVTIFYNESWPAFFTLFNPLLLEFLAGLLLGRAVQQRRGINKTVAATLGCIALAFLFIAPAPQSLPMQRLIWGTLCFFIVQAVVLWENSVGESIPLGALLIGDASYSLYLAHYSLIHLSARELVRLHILNMGTGGLGNEFTVICLYLAVCVLVSLAIYRWIEWPMTSYLRRILKLRKSRVPPPLIVEV